MFENRVALDFGAAVLVKYTRLRAGCRESGKFGIIRGMKFDPTKMKDWQIAEAAEATLRPAADLLRELGINDDEWDAYGRYLAKVDVTKVLRRLGGGDASKAPKRAKYIDVTAITPTALG